MAYTVEALSGFLQIGPHYFPKRRDGAQIIMRGPHGQRLAADPVHTREGRTRGSGFRFWHEELNIPANVKWNPQQVVTGVMGLGDLPVGWSCPYTRSELAGQISKVEVAARAASTPEALESVRAQNEKLRECHMQLGQSLTHKGHLARINVVGQQIAFKKGKIHPSAMHEWSQEEYCRRNPAACRDIKAPCPEYLKPVCDAGEWIKGNWWKVAVGVGAVVVLTGAAKGLGAGFAAKRL